MDDNESHKGKDFKFTETPLDARGNVDEIKARIEKWFQEKAPVVMSNESLSKTEGEQSKVLRAKRT